jgi:EVE domain-containing protein
MGYYATRISCSHAALSNFLPPSLPTQAAPTSRNHTRFQMSSDTKNLNYWLVVTSPENFSHDREVLTFAMQGLPIRYRSSLQRMQIGDRIVYYIMNLYRFGATATVTGDYIEDHSKLWTDNDEMWLSPLVDVPSMEGLGLGFVANHFYVVPVRTNDESCVVVRVVVRAQTRRAIVFATRLHSRAIESFDLLAILGRERQVKMRRLLLGLVQAQ